MLAQESDPVEEIIIPGEEKRYEVPVREGIGNVLAEVLEETPFASAEVSLADLLQGLTGFYLDEKPRPFRNACSEAWGATNNGSCYINTALQLLFASKHVARTLAFVARCHEVDFKRLRSDKEPQLWSFVTQAAMAEVRAGVNAGQTALQGVVDDKALAITFAAAMQGRRSDGESLRGRWLLPSLFLQEFYDGRQEDGGSFLLKVLGTCPRARHHFAGRFTAKELACEEGSC
jgi:hypothetical protein